MPDTTPRPSSSPAAAPAGTCTPASPSPKRCAAACRTCKPVFLCTQTEIDRVILEPTGFEFIPQPIVPPVRIVGGLLKFWKSWRETKDLVRQMLRERKPAAVLGPGRIRRGRRGEDGGAARRSRRRSSTPTSSPARRTST